MDEMEMRFREAGAIRAEKGRRLKVLAAPFGSPSDRDHLNEYFSAKTDFMLNLGDRRPTLYFHGFTPDKKMTPKPYPIGVATASEVTDDGLWMTVDLKEGRLADRVLEAAEAGTCRASTGAVNYLCRSAADGEVEVWPIGELSLLDEGLGRHPVNDKAVALPLRASFAVLDLEVPEVFGEDTEPEPEVSNPEQKTGANMDEIKDAVKAALAERAAMRAKVEAELTAPKIMKEAVLGSDDNQQEHEFFWNMRHRNFQRRTLDETLAAEGLGLMPIGLVNQIHEMASAQSFAQAAGMPVYQTNVSQVTLIREAATPVLSDEVAEEGAISEATDPAFGAVTNTVTKHVDYISVTEELLDDSTLLPAYFKRLAARKMALAENLDVVTTMIDVNVCVGVESAVTDAPTLAELQVCRLSLLPSYRSSGACWFMSETTLEYYRALATTVAAPYKWWEWHEGDGIDSGTLLGHKVYTDPNFPDYNGLTVTHNTTIANLKYGLAKVENPNIGITVNPYLVKDTGWVRFYLGSRWCIWPVQPLVAFKGIINNAH